MSAFRLFRENQNYPEVFISLKMFVKHIKGQVEPLVEVLSSFALH